MGEVYRPWGSVVTDPTTVDPVLVKNWTVMHDATPIPVDARVTVPLMVPPACNAKLMFGVAFGAVTATAVPAVTVHDPPKHGRLLYNWPMRPHAFDGLALTKYVPVGNAGDV